MKRSLNSSETAGVYIKTFGCQMNELDSSKLLRLLEQRGYAAVERPEQAELIVINTCSVREKAAQKARSDLGRLARLKRGNPRLVLAYVGCVAQHEGSAALAREPGCDLVLGTGDLDALPELVEQVRGRGCRLAVTDGLGRDPFPRTTHRCDGPSAFVAVMRGCDNYCAYCIVPFVRGPEISRPRSAIIEEVRALVDQGVREVVLLGQNVNSWGRGLYKRLRFADLLTSAAAVPGIARVRFVTSHPKDLDRSLIRAMAEVPEVCEAIHLPLQSGSSRVLAAMNRGYTAQRYEELVAELRQEVPGVAITTDLIVGFPGEQEQDFEQTLELVRRVRFNDFFSFMYSPRPLCAASKLEDDVSDERKRSRLARLHAVQRTISMERRRELIGRESEVLVSGPSKLDPARLAGRLRTGEIVNFTPRKACVGELALVEITNAHANSLSGRESGRGVKC